ncbi:MAG: citrate synthase [Elusimicrobia bacterium]|nr:citrate synthase [Elusimicrobiota bacterium]
MDTPKPITGTTVAKSSPAHAGLEDTVAGESSICFIDGHRSRLIYRGYSIDDLAKSATFEEVAYLLLFKKLPAQSELKSFSDQLKSQRALPNQFIERMSSIPKELHPMSVLRTLVSALSFYDPDAELMNHDSNLKRAVRVIAQAPAVIAAWDRIRKGKKTVDPRSDLNHAANFLWMLHGKEPDALASQAMELYLVLLADHELNASTFACRVTASTLSDYYSGMTSAIGALKGPLHGGANEQVLKMILEVGEVSHVEEYLKKAFAEKKKIMGFGHRVYKVMDPRSPLLKEMSEKICVKTGNEKLFQITEKIEEIVCSVKKLPSNVDFFSATLLYSLGIPVDLFTPMFVLSRISGWSAHYLEQISDNRLLRPRAEYTGALDLPFIPLENR